MRRFHSYGPVDCEEHFCADRKELIRQCTDQLIGNPEKEGHYFTVWAPRQTGKTWLIRQVEQEIGTRYNDKFAVGNMSVQGVMIKDDEPDDAFLDRIPQLFWEAFEIDMESPPKSWESLKDLFSKNKGIFDRPLILFVDEFDSLPPKVIDQLVTLFRDMYLKRKSYMLHGLALIGVRAVLGVESHRGSPFNIQRSLHVPNLSREEVENLYQQYQDESGQSVEPDVVQAIFESTRGQPGLVCWFGELLTEKYNPGSDKTLGMKDWRLVWRKACYVEWNNTILNLVKKARTDYQEQVLELFTKAGIPFSLDSELCSYLYLNGIIDVETHVDENRKATEICRFSSPFVQERLYNALILDIIGDRMPILVLEPLDDLSDVFHKSDPDIPALLERYKDYLKRLKARGLNPWKDQPRRTDMHLTEAVGHFHLYAWLKEAVDDFCVVSPEFPTGNGKVDLHLRCGQKRCIIEIKSFKSLPKAMSARKQAADYAVSLGLKTVTLALFVPTEDEDVLEKLSGQEVIGGVKVTVSTIGWV
ncbi:MAG: ATP-binding protein [Desulfobacterales bacterium]|nr:ATP-binding protein [Desulfobacterales bacterium]